MSLLLAVQAAAPASVTGSANTAQAQTSSSACAQTFAGTATTAQGSTSTGTGGQAFAGSAGTGQGETTAGAAAQAFTGSATTGQAQTVNGSDTALQPISGAATTGQGQTDDAAGAQEQQARGSGGGRPVYSNFRGGAPAFPRRGFIGAVGDSAQCQQSAGVGTITPMAITGVASTGQKSAEIIALADIDNRRPNNRRKAALLTALLMAA